MQKPLSMRRFMAKAEDVAGIKNNADFFEKLSKLHAYAFSGASAYSAQSFSDLYQDPSVFGVCLDGDGQLNFLSDNETERQVVKTENIIGFAFVRACLDEGEILTVLVAHPYQRRGYGAQMMQALIDKAHDRNIHTLFLEVDEINFAARELYERFGFSILSRRENYYKVGHNALVMRALL